MLRAQIHPIVVLPFFLFDFVVPSPVYKLSQLLVECAFQVEDLENFLFGGASASARELGREDEPGDDAELLSVADFVKQVYLFSSMFCNACHLHNSTSVQWLSLFEVEIV